jgi:hypothetical protein
MCDSTRPEVLDRLHDNDASLTAELLQVSVVQCRNRIALDWDNAWRLDTGGSDRFDREVIDVSVRLAARIPARPVRLIAEGCGLSRAEVETDHGGGKLVSAVRLSGKLRRLHLHAQALSPPRDQGPVRQDPPDRPLRGADPLHTEPGQSCLSSELR